jgi:hypothetical protein
MRLLLTILSTAVPALGMRLLGALLLGLLLAGIAPARLVWAAAVLFLVQVTLIEVLKLLDFNKPPQVTLEGEEADLSGFEPPPLPDPSGIAAERRDAGLKIVTWWLALPALLFAVWAWSEPVVDWYHTLELPTALVIAAGIFLLSWPDRAFRKEPKKRTWVRSAMAGAVVIAAATSLSLRHPYLVPGYPEANRIRAERVLAAGNIVTFQHYAGALVAYALELEQAGQIQNAGDLLNLASRCDGTNPEIQETFADFLKRHGQPGEDAVYRKLAADLRTGDAMKVSSEGYDFDHATPLPVFSDHLPTGHAVVLVGDRDTPPGLLDLVGSVLRTELGVTVYRHPKIIDIETTTRRRGLTSEQVSIDDAWKDATDQLGEIRTGPHQFLVVTARDLFAPGANFLYGSPTSPGSGIVSYARFGRLKDPTADRNLLDALCKQAISTVIKTLTIYPSPDPRDVTAYVNGAFQLSRKGRRPLPATLIAYREQIRKWN